MMGNALPGKGVRTRMQIIQTEEDIAQGVAGLIAVCPHLAKVHGLTGAPPLRRRTGGFAGLAQIVVGQQLSIASADAIWGRLASAIQPFEADRFLQASDKTLRTAGLSAGKIVTLRGIAQAIEDGTLDLDGLAASDEAEITAQLTALKGIGPWTVDIYRMFCLGHADAWSPGDLALQYAVMDALGLEERPSASDMVRIAQAWQPWRGIAARLLWSYYAERRRRGV